VINYFLFLNLVYFFSLKSKVHDIYILKKTSLISKPYSSSNCMIKKLMKKMEEFKGEEKEEEK